MKTVIRKAYVDYEKEEKWLNHMAARGLRLVRYSWCRYEFEDSAPGAYEYRIELLNEMPTHPESKKYLEILAENGIHMVTSYMCWVYFEKNTAEGPLILHSDTPSRMVHYHKIMSLQLILFLCTLPAVMNFVGRVVDIWSTGGWEVAIVMAVLCGLVCIVEAVLVMTLTKNIIRMHKMKKEMHVHE